MTRSETNGVMISFEGVSKKFGEHYALNQLTLDITKGMLFGYLGPNGAGKTTTIKMLAGLMRPTSGVIKINGNDIHTDPMNAKKLIGYVPDKPYVYEKLTAVEFMEFVGGMYGMEPSYIEESSEALFETFEIGSWRYKRAEEYSQGMRQKLLIASSFIHEPAVFIIDEPMIGLDPKNIRRFKNFLRQKADEGTTIFLSTHSLPVAEELCDKIGILRNGDLIACGTLRDLNRFAESEGEALESLFLKITEEDAPEGGY